MVPGFIEIKLWRGGGLGRVHGIFKIMFSFDDSLEAHKTQENYHISDYSLLQQEYRLKSVGKKGA